MRKLLVVSLLTAPPATLAWAQPGNGMVRAVRPEAEGFSTARLTRIDSLILPMVSSGQLPGAVVFIARNGHVVYHKAFGYRDNGTKAPLKVDDIFRIASQSKAITSLAVIALLCEA